VTIEKLIVIGKTITKLGKTPAAMSHWHILAATVLASWLDTCVMVVGYGFGKAATILALARQREPYIDLVAFNSTAKLP
jgi:hypothetical protein